jgi:hypothetical protein
VRLPLEIVGSHKVRSKMDKLFHSGNGGRWIDETISRETRLWSGLGLGW